MTATTAGMLMIVGSVAFLVGAAIAVPRVFMEPDATTRLHLIEQHPRLWRAGHPLYFLGPLIASVGVGVLAASDVGPGGAAWLGTACVLFLIGVGFPPFFFYLVLLVVGVGIG